MTTTYHLLTSYGTSFHCGSAPNKKGEYRSQGYYFPSSLLHREIAKAVVRCKMCVEIATLMELARATL
jgi:hypothetical protein